MPLIQLSDELLENMVECEAAFWKSRVDDEQAKSRLTSNIDDLEGALVEVTLRLPALRESAILSDAAAGNLILAERRVSAIRDELEKLRLPPVPRLNVAWEACKFCLSRLADEYRSQLERRVLDVLEPFGFPSHLLPLVAHADAFRVLTAAKSLANGKVGAVGNYPATLFAYFRRARAGVVNLNVDPGEGAAPPDTQPPQSA